jgi:hypothetical protein
VFLFNFAPYFLFFPLICASIFKSQNVHTFQRM